MYDKIKTALLALAILACPFVIFGCGPEQSIDRADAPSEPSITLPTETPPPAAASCKLAPTVASVALPSTTMVPGRNVVARFTLTGANGTAIKDVSIWIADVSANGVVASPALRIVGEGADLPATSMVSEKVPNGHNLVTATFHLAQPLAMTGKPIVVEMRADANGFVANDQIWSMYDGMMRWIEKGASDCEENQVFDRGDWQYLTF